ncbi:MAG: phenylalanine--tRNA ligase subunit alpha [Myxococcota bacterium]
MPDGTPDLEAQLAEARQAIADASSKQDLSVAKARFLGKKGSVSGLLRQIGRLDPSERKAFGEAVNRAKAQIEEWAGERLAALERSATEDRLDHAVDVTLPGAGPPAGHLHPLTHITRDMVQFFTSLGFSIEEGPEVETEYNNFEALNIPAHHPARDMQDTFFLEGGAVLRTHTSNVQIRAMTGRTPPFRFIAPGRVYRHDLSPRHSPMFNQIEGFLVDDRVTLGDLKGVLLAFGRRLFGKETELRFRANHFPFTEPSAELDYSCALCDRKGCKVCSDTGWVEWGGCGMIHPKVLERCGIDTERFQGFAFGMGIDRTAMERFQIPHLRHLFEGDVRVLEQV